MADTVLPKADPQMLDQFLRAQAQQLRAKDEPPRSRQAWAERRGKLHKAMLAAMGPMPDKPCPLEVREVGVLKRQGYRIEKIVFQSRPDVWVTGSVYVPEPVKGRHPAVLVVHGHWAGARRDPVVQARCLGLVKLGFVVLAVDAFGAGERHPTPVKGAYHGALLGSTLWPTGQTLLGMQVYDNRRAVDYLLSRSDVDGERLGITGASGGGNQTMYAGALDERFKAVVPVCSVGTYQAYLHAACCVCEVLPGALRFTEEGDVLGLVMPRSLLVISASKDAFQFSVGEAKKSLERARAIYQLHGRDNIAHAVFESPHAYNQPMREAMYGWMTRWLKNEGDGKPIPEPKHEVDTPEDLSCFPDGKRPAGFLFPSTFAAREANRVLAPILSRPPDHKEAWQTLSLLLRAQLRDALGEMPEKLTAEGRLAMPQRSEEGSTVALQVMTEPGLVLPALVRYKGSAKGKMPACVLLHLDGKDEALKHPLASALLEAGWVVIAPNLRGTGETKPANDAIAGAPDHNSAEHAVWVGRPLLGQWVVDVACLLSWMGRYPGYNRDRLAVIGLGQAGLVALCTAALDIPLAAVAALDTPATLLTSEAYPAGLHMGLLAPGLLHGGDVPQLAALHAPRKLLLAGAVNSRGQKLDDKQMAQAFAFTREMYRLQHAQERLKIVDQARATDLAMWLG